MALSTGYVADCNLVNLKVTWTLGNEWHMKRISIIYSSHSRIWVAGWVLWHAWYLILNPLMQIMWMLLWYSQHTVNIFVIIVTSTQNTVSVLFYLNFLYKIFSLYYLSINRLCLQSRKQTCLALLFAHLFHFLLRQKKTLFAPLRITEFYPLFHLSQIYFLHLKIFFIIIFVFLKHSFTFIFISAIILTVFQIVWFCNLHLDLIAPFVAWCTPCSSQFSLLELILGTLLTYSCLYYFIPLRFICGLLVWGFILYILSCLLLLLIITMQTWLLNMIMWLWLNFNIES